MARTDDAYPLGAEHPGAERLEQERQADPGVGRRQARLPDVLVLPRW